MSQSHAHRRSENKHQVLQYYARTVLITANLPTSYWAEAVATATYIINRLPTAKNKGKSPYEVWMGYKPSIAHIRIFGSPTYAYIPDQKRKKMDPCSEKLILVGYADELKAYKLFNPRTKKASYARSVIVHEAQILQSIHTRRSLDPAAPGGIYNQQLRLQQLRMMIMKSQITRWIIWT